jgi:hypothetical protein
MAANTIPPYSTGFLHLQRSAHGLQVLDPGNYIAMESPDVAK